jgi:two-component system phosphate regulon sensor histidine kinase PhoR
MLIILISSILLFVILVLMVVYQTKTYIRLKDINQLREDLTNAYFHNIKMPLGTISAYIENYRLGLFDDRKDVGERQYALVRKSIDGINALAEQILTISKSENRNLTIERTETDISGIIEELKDKFSINNKKQVNISTSYYLKDKTVYLDSGLIKYAVANLIDNAVKYSNDPVNININCGLTEDNLLQICVKDDGFGISPKDMEKIFEKFERGAALKRKGGATGFGLGLSFVRGVVKAHNGTINISSEPGKGSEFSLSFPVEK